MSREAALFGNSVGLGLEPVADRQCEYAVA